MLDPRIKKKILDSYDHAGSDGKLYSRAQLDRTRLAVTRS